MEEFEASKQSNAELQETVAQLEDRVKTNEALMYELCTTDVSGSTSGPTPVKEPQSSK